MRFRGEEGDRITLRPLRNAVLGDKKGMAGLLLIPLY
jgi:hypothetical protein